MSAPARSAVLPRRRYSTSAVHHGCTGWITNGAVAAARIQLWDDPPAVVTCTARDFFNVSMSIVERVPPVVVIESEATCAVPSWVRLGFSTLSPQPRSWRSAERQRRLIIFCSCSNALIILSSYVNNKNNNKFRNNAAISSPFHLSLYYRARKSFDEVRFFFRFFFWR